MSDCIQVVTTTATEDEARRIARALVERRLAACVQVSGPIESTYWWQGQIETGREWRLTAKSRSDLFAALEEAIRELHSYSVPEILATPVESGGAAYLEWMNRELRPHDA